MYTYFTVGERYPDFKRGLQANNQNLVKENIIKMRRVSMPYVAWLEGCAVVGETLVSEAMARRE